MKKLTETQMKALNNIYKNLNRYKESESVLDLLLKYDLEGRENRSDYDELKAYTIKRYNDYKEHYDKVYAENLKEAKEQNIVLATGNSSTLRALEKAGYIEIISLGGMFPDKVKVLKEFASSL